MPNSEIVPERIQTSTNSTQSSASGDMFSRRMRSEIIRLAIISVLVFAVILIFDIGGWVEGTLLKQNHRIIDIITGIVTVSFVLLIFLIRGWQDVRKEAVQRAVAVKQTEHRNVVNAQLSQMTSLLHACFTLEEASTIISHFARQLFPDHAGMLYVFRSSRNLLELTTKWGGDESNELFFGPQQCWGLRQGQMYAVLHPESSIICGHVHHTRPYSCLPLMAHGEVLALLHVTPNSDEMKGEGTVDAHYALLRVFIEPIALALSNLKLRESLRQQSIRDPLTGLFNRRYLEETLGLEVERSRRSNVPFTIMMLDLDHFKQFNDTHGHEAGDVVLQTFGSFIQRHVRGGDIACRYGGEEFTLVLPATSIEVAQQRAEQICEEIRALNIDFKQQILGPLTVSVGVASFPMHGEMGEVVLQAADAALYQAKSQGRDRVVVTA